MVDIIETGSSNAEPHGYAVEQITLGSLSPGSNVIDPNSDMPIWMLSSRFRQRGGHLRYLIAFALAVLVATLGSPTYAKVLIGLGGPFTGQLAWIGEQVQRGAEMAVADVNAAGNVLGQQVELILADDFCDPQQAVAAAKKLISDGVVFVVGHMCSEAAIPASNVYEAAGVLQMSPTATNPILTEQGLANVFRTIGRDDAQGAVAGNYLADHWVGRKIAIFNDGTTYGKGLADETKRQLNKRGVTEAIYADYLPGKHDYSAEVDALQEAGISVLYLGGRHLAAALIVRAARDRENLFNGNASCDALRILLEDKGFSRRDDVCTEVIEVGERI